MNAYLLFTIPLINVAFMTIFQPNLSVIELGSDLYRHRTSVTSATMHGPLVLTTCRNCEMHVWSEGKLVKSLKTEIEIPLQIKSIENDLFVLFGDDSKIARFDSIDSKPVYLKAHARRVSGIAKIPSSRSFLSCGLDGKVFRWNNDQAIEIYSTDQPILSIEVNPNSKNFFINENGRLVEINLSAKQAKRHIEMEKTSDFRFFDETHIVINNRQQDEIQLLDLTTQTLKTIAKSCFDCWEIKNGLLYGMSRRNMSVLDVQTGRKVGSRTIQCHTPVFGMEFIGDSKIIIACESCRPAFVDRSDLSTINLDEGHDDCVDSLVFLNERELVSVGDCYINRWDITSQKCISKEYFGATWNVLCEAEMATSNRLLLVAGKKGLHSLLHMNLNTNQIKEWTKLEIAGTIISKQQSSDLKSIFLGEYRDANLYYHLLHLDADGKISQRTSIKLKKGIEIEKAFYHFETEQLVGIDSRNRLFLVKSDGTIKFLKLNLEPFDLGYPEYGVHFFSSSRIANGCLNVAIANGNKIVIVNIDREEKLFTLSMNNRLRGLSVASNGTHIAFKLLDGSVNLVNFATGTPEKTIEIRPRSKAVRLAFSPNCEMLAIAEENGIISIYQFPSE
jgi:WD40 repeat protein